MTKVIVPIGSQVLCKLVKKDATASGIALPETAQQEEGFVVLAMGEKVNKVKKGDFILFKNKESVAIKFEGLPENLFLVREEDILGTVKTVE